MKSYFESENKTLLAKIPKENCRFSKTEYINCWYTILVDVEVYKPQYLLIDTYELCYRRLPEVGSIFNDISHKIGAVNIAVVKCNNILGRYTLETLLNDCPLKGHTITNNDSEGITWLNAQKSIFSNLNTF